MKKSGIYLITNMENGKEYCGSTIQPFYVRWQQHKYELNKGIHPNKHLRSAWKKYGESAFVFEILETVERSGRTKKQFSKYLERLEDYYIALRDLRNDKVGYNKLRADRQECLERTEEHCANLSAAMKGKPSPMKGKKHTRESITKMSLVQTNALWKTDISPERREELANRARGNRWHNGIWELTSPDGDVLIVDRLAGFCREHNLSASNLRKTAYGQRKHSKGWKARLISSK